ncbi:AraC family transcriptional regulator [Mycobacterium sp. 852002-40037_SCH5390672]|nr:AraC family transcriptional regulator [Mycobacterium sp. 852002-40037_SCH5390672]
MVGYRALNVAEMVHRGMPSSTLTFIVSLDDGVESADTTDALTAARPNPLVLGGLHVQVSHVRQCRGQAGVQLAVHPLASRALFGVPSAELPVTGFDGVEVLGPPAARLPERAAEAREWSEVFRLRRPADLLSEESRQMPCTHFNLVGQLGHRYSAGPHGQHRRRTDGPPRGTQRQLRFQHASARIAASARAYGRVDLAAIAADTGYCDQAHLTREFVRFAGVPPRAWLADEFRNIQDSGHSWASQCDHDYFESDRLVNAAST